MTAHNTRDQPSLLAHISPPGFTIRDEMSGRHFLIDTGALASVYPAEAADRSSDHDTRRAPVTLTAANGMLIHSYGTW